MNESQRHHSVLFVCLGNICRSPLAEGVFRRLLSDRELADAFHVDSCGTGAWHVGNPPDPRSVEVALAHDIDISRQRARQLSRSDYDEFQWIVAMDGANARTIEERAPRGHDANIVPFMSFVPNASHAGVPDPYYGGDDGFLTVYRLLLSGMGPLIDAVLRRGTK